MKFRTRLLPIFTGALVASAAMADLVELAGARVKGGPGIAPSGEFNATGGPVVEWDGKPEERMPPGMGAAQRAPQPERPLHGWVSGEWRFDNLWLEGARP